MTTFKVEERRSIFQFRHQGRLLDVKLAGEGGFVRAHRVVLAAGFHTLFFSSYVQYFSSLSFYSTISNTFPPSPFFSNLQYLSSLSFSSTISNIFPRSPFLQLCQLWFLLTHSPFLKYFLLTELFPPQPALTLTTCSRTAPTTCRPYSLGGSQTIYNIVDCGLVDLWKYVF